MLDDPALPIDMRLFRRIVYGLLLVSAFAPQVRLATVGSIATSDAVLLIRIAVLSFFCLAIWSTVWLREEPMLARIAIVLVGLMLLGSLWVHKL
jgi:hypothetical protein